MSKAKFFKTKVQRFEGVGTWTFADIPFDVEKEFGVKGRVKVKATIQHQEFQAVLMPHGNSRHFIILTREIRDKAKTKVGDNIELSVELDNTQQDFIVPESFMKALKKNEPAQEYFNSLAPSHRKEYVKWIDEAKKEETKNNRILKAIEKLSASQKLK